VADGNMKLVHLKMRCPEDDVSLSDGELFMVKRGALCEPFSDSTRTTTGESSHGYY
jgi:hypothetical protein